MSTPPGPPDDGQQRQADGQEHAPAPVTALAARRKFGAIIGPVMFAGAHQVITKNGQPVAVLVPYDWYAQATTTTSEDIQP